MHPTQTQRIGRFNISPNLMRHDWRKLQKFMREVVVVSAYYDYARNEISYTAISDLFELVPALMKAPFYTLEFKSIRVLQADHAIQFELSNDFTLTREK